ncbi:MAG: glycosyltransferase [Elusimicrobiota bacterium]|nr:glycosyltransferase [Elusimicrobiota bacterium]
MKFSVIVAARNERAQLGAAMKRLRHISSQSSMELIIVDGASDDGTAEAAREWSETVIALDSPLRSAQWNAGAAKATGDLLFFLPADVHPPDAWQQALEHFWLSTPTESVAATAFSVEYGAGLPLKLLAAWSNARARGGAATTDHGLCTTPETFKAVGGFPAVERFEDAAFCRRLASRGRVALLPNRIRPASRRIHADGAASYAIRRVWGELTSPG